jgi:hypothetical protein
MGPTRGIDQLRVNEKWLDGKYKLLIRDCKVEF